MTTVDPIMAKEFAKFERQLKNLEKMTMKSQGEVLHKYSGMFALGLARGTLGTKRGKNIIKGSADSQKAAGEKRVNREVMRAYTQELAIFSEIKQQSAAVAKVFWAKWMSGDEQGVIQLFSTLDLPSGKPVSVGWDKGQAHKNRRKSGAKRLLRMGDSGQAMNYSKEVQKRVGYAKAGWVQGLRSKGKIHGGKIPAWVTRHRGNGKMVESGKGGVVRRLTFINYTKGLKKIFRYNVAKNSLNSVAKKMQKDMHKAVVEAAKKVK